MPEKQRLTEVLEALIVPKGEEGLEALADVRALAAFDPEVLAAIATDATKRGLDLERGLEVARGYVAARLAPAAGQEAPPDASPVEPASTGGEGEK